MVYTFGGELAAFGRDDQNLVSVGFDGTRLVHVDVCRFCRYYTFASQKQGINDRLVTLCSTYQEKDVGLGTSYGLTYLLLGTCCVWIGTITRSLVVVFRYQA